ncbi:MAG: glutaredoxin 3 [Woeseiaceae bacterium]|jgi:glutaredoxin 3
MAHTEIYFKDWCPYSQRALALLTRKGVAFEAIDLTTDKAGRELEMRERSGHTSVPQIFINGRHIGGFDDLSALEQSGELDQRLSDKNVASAA